MPLSDRPKSISRDSRIRQKLMIASMWSIFNTAPTFDGHSAITFPIQIVSKLFILINALEIERVDNIIGLPKTIGNYLKKHKSN